MTTEARIAIPRVIGSVPLTTKLSVDTQAWATVSRVIGSVQLLAGPYTTEALANVSRVIGSVNITLAQPVAVRASVSPVVGSVRMYGEPSGGLWTKFGLPAPHAVGYSYGNRNGLVRTQMSNGAVRQRIRWLKSLRGTNVVFDVTREQLALVEEVLTAVGAGWWDIPLITGDSTVAEAHKVRLVEPISFTALGDDRRYEVSMSLEVL